MIQRYTPDCSGDMIESETGFYVEYDEYALLKKNYDMIKEQFRHLEYAIKDIDNTFKGGPK